MQRARLADPNRNSTNKLIGDDRCAPKSETDKIDLLSLGNKKSHKSSVQASKFNETIKASEIDQFLNLGDSSRSVQSLEPELPENNKSQAREAGQE